MRCFRFHEEHDSQVTVHPGNIRIMSVSGLLAGKAAEQQPLKWQPFGSDRVGAATHSVLCAIYIFGSEQPGLTAPFLSAVNSASLNGELGPGESTAMYSIHLRALLQQTCSLCLQGPLSAYNCFLSLISKEKGAYTPVLFLPLLHHHQFHYKQ